jgi:Leucine-rich repeat (LRR) protein
VFVEPTHVLCVQPDRSIPIVVRFPTIRALNFVGQTLGHELRDLPKLPELERLSFIQCEFVDSLAFLGNLHSLRYLSITGTTLTNQHFDELRLLSNMNSLTELDLSTTNVSSLEFLASMSDLEVLRLVATRITDDDMQLIATLEKLRVLEVGWTEITDASVDVLREVKGLQELNIRGTRVTEDGLRQLESSISHVFHDDFSSQ